MSQPEPVLLQHPGAAPHARFTLLSVTPASEPGFVLVRLATGPSRRELTGGTAYGPFPDAEAVERLHYVVERLCGAGYQLFGPHTALIERLSDPSRRARALAAANLGWRRASDAVPALLAAATAATSELPIIIDALGRIGDARALAICREQASKKLLSRRRSGVEALRRLADHEGLAQARVEGLARLPEAIATLLGSLDESQERADQIQTLSVAMLALEPVRRGLLIDQLYEFGTPLCVRAVRVCLQQDWHHPHLWRYTKSIWKRAMLRTDATTFAQLALAFERSRGRTPAVRTTLKSGLDGQARKTPVFGARTQAWLVRASARWLRRLAYWQRDAYAPVAASVLAHDSAVDARDPIGLQGPFAHALLFHRLLHAAGSRFRVDASARVIARNAAAVSQVWSRSDVPFVDRWEAQPLCYLQLAAFGLLAEVRSFGSAGVLSHPDLLQQASSVELAALIGADPALALLAEAEVNARFDLASPDLELCAALLDGAEHARELSLCLLAASAPVWIKRSKAVALLLQRRSMEARVSAALAVQAAMITLDSDALAELLSHLLDALDSAQAQASPERSSALINVLLSYPDAAAQARSLEQILAWVQDGDLPRRTVGGALLGAHPDALQLLGTARLVALADSEVQTVRAAACVLVGRAIAQLQTDPWPLLTLAQTRFPDTRRCAFELLSELDVAHLHLDALVALCDSTHAQVQDFAKSWIAAHLEQIEPAALLERLIEHPHAPMRAFALQLLEAHLPAGAQAFAHVGPFLRSTLLTPRMSRPAKDRLLRFTEQRGLQDAEQGALALAVLGAALRTAVQRDFEPLVLALTRIQLRHPELRGDWQLRTTETAR